MAAPRANWRGTLKVGEVACPVALYTAVSASERIAFHTLNRSTGHRVRRLFIDSKTRKPVEPGDQAKGYEIGQDDYVILEPEEVAAAVPESDKTLRVESFIACADIDDIYLDRPYYLAPGDRSADEAFGLIRDGIRAKKVAALAQTVLFRRVRTLLIRAHGDGLVATALNFDYEVRSAKDAFDGIAPMTIKGEMLDLAKHIIKTKSGRFDPGKHEDRYEAALAEVVKAKLEGRPVEVEKPPAEEKVVDLMEALRRSAGQRRKTNAKTGAKTRAKTGGTAKRGARKAAKRKTRPAPSRRKVG